MISRGKKKLKKNQKQKYQRRQNLMNNMKENNQVINILNWEQVNQKILKCLKITDLSICGQNKMKQINCYFVQYVKILVINKKIQLKTLGRKDSINLNLINLLSMKVDQYILIMLNFYLTKEKDKKNNGEN